MAIRALFVSLFVLVAAPALAADDTANWPNYREGDYTVADYKFTSGETMPQVKLHYRVLGTPKKNAAGEIINGVLMLQGNTGTSANWLRPTLAGELFKTGQPLDAGDHFIIMPDALGRGGSSKPSDGLKGKFPHYRYHDMVDLTHRLVTDGLKVTHLRLVIGSSLGCMQQFLWAETYPDLMDGTVGLSCQPVEISGRNYMTRHATAQAIRNDPAWNNGDYTPENKPKVYAYVQAGNFMTESAVRIQEMAPTAEAAKAFYDKRLAASLKGDPNNTLYETESIEDYNPEPDLPKIKAKLLLINTVEDVANPPELGTVERGMAKIKDGKYVLIPYSKETHGHFTHYYGAVWKPYLIDFMKTLPPGKQAAAQ